MASPDKKDTKSPKKLEALNDRERTSNLLAEDESLPRYYDSEPSSLPPHYSKASSTAPEAKRRSTQQQPQLAGASAASVAAMLASPSPEKFEKRSWRERWRELKSGLIHVSSGDVDNLYRPDNGSTAHWNAFGSRIDGGLTMKRNTKR